MNFLNKIRILTLLASATAIASSLNAQELQQSIVNTSSLEQAILPIGQADVGGTITIDPNNQLYLIFGSPRTTLDITLTSPTSIQYNLEAPPINGVESYLSPERSQSTTGVNYIFKLDSPETGDWAYVISDQANRTKDSAVFIMSTSDSNIRSGVLGGGTDYVVNNPMTLAVFVVEGDTNISGYTISGEVKNPSNSTPWQPVSFVDDGSPGDFLAGDGISSTVFTPTDVGLYRFKGKVSGANSSGDSYVRTVITTFRVVAPSADLQGYLNDRGIDNDGDGLFEQIATSFQVDVTTSGDYYLRVTLETSSGAQVSSNTSVNLGVGAAIVEVPFDTSILSDIGDDGPYQIVSAILELRTANDILMVDRATDLGQTSPWLISQFDRESIELTDVFDAVGEDFNANGLYDNLKITFGLDILNPGFYSYSAQLVDSNGTEIGFAAGNQTLLSQAIIELNFAGVNIGENGVDGPYSVRNLTINGPAARIVEFVGSTGALLASSFEGYVSPDTEPPVLELSVSPSEIWPPNHQMIPLQIDYTVADNLDPNPAVNLVSVTSSDGENEIGDGNHSPDIEISTDGDISVRAERAGPKENRIYTIIYRATDAVGNSTTSEVTVTVLHDKRKNR